MFGPALDRAVSYARLLAGTGVEHGVIGPGEVPRLWERHLLNCAVIGELIGPGESVVDVGSGAGLPGIPLALARPDLRVTLVESVARRVAFLTLCRDTLELDTVTVLHGRAEDRDTRTLAAGADVVTSRAVASLDRLAAWCLPLVRPSGRMLAIKGQSAHDEISTHGDAVRRSGGVRIGLERLGAGVVGLPTTVVVVERGEAVGRSRKGRSDARRR